MMSGDGREFVLNPKLDQPEIWAQISELRKLEMDRAREILGIRQEWLGFVDSGLPEGDPLPPLPEGCFGLQDVDAAAERLVRVIREQRPHVVLTYDENGGYPHPDHIMTHKISVVAFDAAGDPERYPDAGEPWQPLKLYYHMWARARWFAIHEAILAAGMESPFTEWIQRAADWPDRDDRITTRVECGDWFETRDDALRAHATQVDPEGFWFKAPMDIQRKVWPTEDYELVRSFVDSPVPEDDLFTGVAETVRA